MKKLLLLSFLICTVLSCSPNDDDNSSNFYYETLPIESVIMPTEFQLGVTYEIKMTYIKPSGCHVFNDFYYLSELNQRTIAIITTVFPDQNCENIEEEVEVTLNFNVNDLNPYVFRFWQGEDDNGNDTYYVIEIPVVD
ncbi:hypothetical protein [Psychroserpens ponticola]|uniref:Uncharacterized protein n=1 Tax=Psychroserpens ponticola TaxID=2932268 RepID=A0ABY7RWV8_9FLAO|nr:hypothetical protein [Psychroserpens ponticola]WCO01599.1 hypothetical protein MUN68_016240 [Psychroserpens ponticola]